MTAIGKLEESIYGVDDDEINVFIYFFSSLVLRGGCLMAHQWFFSGSLGWLEFCVVLQIAYGAI